MFSMPKSAFLLDITFWIDFLTSISFVLANCSFETVLLKASVLPYLVSLRTIVTYIHLANL